MLYTYLNDQYYGENEELSWGMKREVVQIITNTDKTVNQVCLKLHWMSCF